MLSAIACRQEYLDELQELLRTANILLARKPNRVSWLGQLKTQIDLFVEIENTFSEMLRTLFLQER